MLLQIFPPFFHTRYEFRTWENGGAKLLHKLSGFTTAMVSCRTASAPLFRVQKCDQRKVKSAHKSEAEIVDSAGCTATTLNAI